MRPLLTLVLFLLAGCGGGGTEEAALAPAKTRSWPEGLWERAAAADEASLRYHALPGVEGFSELPARVRSVALAAAHEERCPCGCSHSVAYCVNEHQGCLVCPIRAGEIVAEAMRRHGGEDEAPAPPPEPTGGRGKDTSERGPEEGEEAPPGKSQGPTDSTQNPPAGAPDDEGKELKRP